MCRASVCRKLGLGGLESDLQACCLPAWRKCASPLETRPSRNGPEGDVVLLGGP